MKHIQFVTTKSNNGIILLLFVNDIYCYSEGFFVFVCHWIIVYLLLQTTFDAFFDIFLLKIKTLKKYSCASVLISKQNRMHFNLLVLLVVEHIIYAGLLTFKIYDTV